MQRKWLTTILVGLATAVAALTIVSPDSRAAPAATTYYVCNCQQGADGDCVAGNDGGSGTSAAAPWQTYDRARTHFNSSISAGDEILFCRGGAFDLGSGSGQWVSTSCTAAQPCIVADYLPSWASGDEARPILWKTADGHAFDLANNGDAVAEGGYVFRNLDMRCTACSSAGWAFFLFNDVNDVTIENVATDGFGIGVHLAGANPCAAGNAQCNGQNDRITISNASITNSSGQGILGGANDLLIANSYFENNGSGTIFDHNIYISGGSRITILNNELYRASLDGGGSCGGTSLVGHGVLNDLRIEGNWVHEDVGKANQTCWGISITTGYSTAESFSNVTIRGNRVENVGNVAIGTSACISCTIENNAIIHHQGYGLTGIAVPDKTPGPEDAMSDNVTIRNNSLLTSAGYTGIRLAAGSGHTVVSNALQSTTADSGWNCFDLPLPGGSYNAVDYNVCGYSAGEWANGVGDLAAWQALGWGAGSQAALPDFTSPTNLMPGAATAVVVDAGHPALSSATDLLGNGRDALPDAGAYEWLGNWQVIWLPVVVSVSRSP